MAEATEGGRTLKRWVASCEYESLPEGKTPLVASVSRRACPFNERKSPTLHANAQAAVRESITHAVAAGHIGGREVQVHRTYTPRTIASEEVVQ